MSVIDRFLNPFFAILCDEKTSDAVKIKSIAQAFDGCKTKQETCQREVQYIELQLLMIEENQDMAERLANLKSVAPDFAAISRALDEDEPCEEDIRRMARAVDFKMRSAGQAVEEWGDLQQATLKNFNIMIAAEGLSRNFDRAAVVPTDELRQKLVASVAKMEGLKQKYADTSSEMKRFLSSI